MENHCKVRLRRLLVKTLGTDKLSSSYSGRFGDESINLYPGIVGRNKVFLCHSMFTDVVRSTVSFHMCNCIAESAIFRGRQRHRIRVTTMTPMH